MIEIQNRRYIGNKSKLLCEIYESVMESGVFIGQQPVFADIFGGTGVVADFFLNKGFDIIVNDILHSNFASYKAWFSNLKINRQKIIKELEYFNSLSYEDIKENYFSKIYGGKYFSFNDAKKIGFIRDYIELHKSEYNEREYYYLITSLLYAADKIANTVGHFEHFLKSKPVDSKFQLKELNIINHKNCEIYNADANELIKRIKCDILYLDPPYNARQYVNFYHVLENLTRWEKPTEFEGSSMKFKRNNLKSGYSRSIATSLFKDLIDNSNCKLIIVSYNNTYSARSNASNNKISETDLLSILKSKGDVIIKELNYKFFNSGKTNFKHHMEKLYICKVR